MEWYDAILPMRDPFGLSAKNFDDMEDSLHVQLEDEMFGQDWLDSYATEILDAKYEKTDINDLVDKLDHLNNDQKNDLRKVLNKNAKLFNGTLGVYPHKKVHIDIDPKAEPVHARAYPVPHVHMDTFK